MFGVFGAIRFYHLGYITWKLFQRDGISGIALLLVYDLGVDLRRGHVFMRKHLADSVDVSAVGYQQCSISVAQAMEYTRQSKRQRTGKN